MDEHDKARDLATILEDVKTIKSILQNQDAPLPPVWRLLYSFAVPGLVLIALTKFFYPPAAALSFLDTIVWVWLPVLTVVAIVVAIRVSSYLKKTGTRFMAQSRVQIFLYTRMILVPSVITLGYLLSLNTAYSMEGAMAVLIAVGLTQVTVILPRVFRVAPFLFLFLGWAELALDLRGAVWTLANTLAAATMLVWVATLLKRDVEQAEGR